MIRRLAHPSLAALALSTAAALALPALAAAQQGEPFHWNGSLASGQTLEIRGVNGDVRLRPTTGEARVDAAKHARRDDPASVHVEVVHDGDAVVICAVYPTPRDAERENRCAAGDDYHMSNKTDVVVDFDVAVPAGVHVVARTVNGDVRGDTLRGDVVARTVNGEIRVSTTGRALASTVNGAIFARFGNADFGSDAAFTTVNGSITLEAPASLAADLDFATVNGSIESEFPLQVSGRIRPNQLHGSVGGGGPRLRLHTVNGSIHLNKAG